MLITKDKNFYKSIFRLAIPIALQNLVTFSVALTDTLMVGRLGDLALSGVYMGNQVQMLLQVFCAGVEGAILALCSQHFGKRDSDGVKKASSIGTLFLLSVGTLLTILCISAPRAVVSLFAKNVEIIDTGTSYLGILAFSFIFFCISQSLVATMRSVECTKVGFFASLISLLVNALLDYALIFGRLGFPRLEIRGAAIATVLARASECLIMIIYVFFIDKKLKIRVRNFLKLDIGHTVNFMRHASPIILGQIIWGINILFCSAVIGRLGSESAVTALSVANTLNNLAYVVTNGISASLGIIIGKLVGEDKKNTVKEYSKTAQILFLVFGVLTMIVIQLTKNPFISFYGISQDAAKESARFINVLSLTALGTCYQSACLFGLLKSGGDMKFVFWVEACSVFLAVLPLSLITVKLGFAPSIVFLALKCDQFLKCIPAAIRVNRFRWMKNIAASNQ